ncbi:cation channel sperm-associated auxiliary subunit delta isoform X2 [Manis pentadactyla]|nr:cation channel sperm-associated auxiliary subunit delta isoform X2 [Manis pentadactyla]
MSGDNCCYSGSPSCLDISKSVFAYLLGDQLSQANVYFSDTQGYSFQKFAHKRQAEPDGTLGGIFYFHSLSQVGTLLVNHGQAKFSYSDHPLNLTFVLPFNYSEPLEVLIVPGQRGFLIFWFEKSLLVSVNEGQLVKPVVVQKGRRTLYSSISEANISIRGVAANTHQLAVLTRENTVYYGNLGYLSNSLIKFPKGHIWSQEAALMFTDVGMLEILTPVPDPVFPAFDFQRCLVNVQASLMDLHVDDCKVELLEGDFADKMYTVDMYGTLELTALMVPKAGTSPVPLPMLSNPHSLGIHDAIMYEDGYRYDGRTMHRMNISLRQQQFCGRADANFTSDIKRPTMSTISLDIDDKEISCVDLKPLTALISVGCDHEKEIVVRKEVSACYKGILDIMALSDNYSYVIERDAYDPNFRGQKATKDQVVHYPYDRLGCPDLVYYDNPWKPVVEMWRKGKFQEVVHTEYVLQEVNGLFTYTYSLSARSALCRAQPQNWTTVMEPAGGEGRSAWHREVRAAFRSHKRSRRHVVGGQVAAAGHTQCVRGRAPCAGAAVPPPQIRTVRPQTPAPRGPGGRGPKATVTAASVCGPGRAHLPAHRRASRRVLARRRQRSDPVPRVRPSCANRFPKSPPAPITLGIRLRRTHLGAPGASSPQRGWGCWEPHRAHQAVGRSGECKTSRSPANLAQGNCPNGQRCRAEGGPPGSLRLRSRSCAKPRALTPSRQQVALAARVHRLVTNRFKEGRPLGHLARSVLRKHLSPGPTERHPWCGHLCGLCRISTARPCRGLHLRAFYRLSGSKQRAGCI